MYIHVHVAPSSGHELLNLSLPFKVILRRFEVVWSANAALKSIDQYYLMALKP